MNSSPTNRKAQPPFIEGSTFILVAKEGLLQ